MSTTDQRPSRDLQFAAGRFLRMRRNSRTQMDGKHFPVPVMVELGQFNIRFELGTLQGKTVFYHEIIIQTENNKEFVSVKCITAVPFNSTENSHVLRRRDVLPAGFEEPM